MLPTLGDHSGAGGVLFQRRVLADVARSDGLRYRVTGDERMVRFTVNSTSRQTADVAEPLIVSLRPDPDGSIVRRLVLATCVDNPRNPAARLAITVRHQRRPNHRSDWEPVNGFGPADLRAGQEIRLDFDTSETLALSQRLTEWYAVCGGGVQIGERILSVVNEDEVTILRGNQRAILEAMLESQADFWDLLQELQPDLLTAAAAARLRRERLTAIEAFDQHMRARDWQEADWQRFFTSNIWIFGHGLAYQILGLIQDQPALGGGGIDRHGQQIGDYLLATEARARFTVLVEIKTPQTELLGHEYRTGVFEIGREVAGGVAQAQRACRTWVLEGETAEANRDLLRTEQIETYEPKAILVVGDAGRLASVPHRRSFELFRRNLHNPEILTFDELLARARFLLGADPPEP